MPEQLYGLTLNDIRWLRRLRADMDRGDVRIFRRRDTASGPNVQVVKASSATLDTSDANEDRYPGHWYERNPSTGAYTQKDAVWIKAANGTALDTTKYHESAIQHGHENDRPLFIVPDSGLGASGSDSRKTLFVLPSPLADNVTSTTFADVSNSSVTFTLSANTKAILAVKPLVELMPDTDTTYFGVNVRPVVNSVNGLSATHQIRAISGGNVVQGGIFHFCRDYELDLSSGSNTIKLQAARVSTGGDGTAPTMQIRNGTTWTLHVDQGTVS